MDLATQLTELSEPVPVSTNKDALQKTLKLLSSFDPVGSPYVAVQFVEGKPEFYRSSANGFAHTKNFSAEEIFVDLHHFLEYLKCLPDNVDLTVAPNGVLRLYAINGNFTSTMFVHTVQKGQAGQIRHTPVGRSFELKPNTFTGLDVRHISNLSGHPTISNGMVMIPTNVGAVVWNGAAGFLPPASDFSPKFSFLKLVSGEAVVEDLYVSQNGYWRAIVDGMVVYTKGQGPNNPLFRRMTLPGVEICRFTATALLWGLSAATGLIGDMEFVTMDPRFGITSQDKFGNPATWTLDEGLDWPKFRINGGQAKLIVNTLKQAQDDHIVLYDVPNETSPLLRFFRGNFTVNVSL
jgi:hypothetical protein